MVDYYLWERSRLNGQPKRTIADYVEANGILVPKKFDTLAEAKKSGKQILLRSEHPQDYDGASGLFKSKTLSELPDTNDEKMLRSELLKVEKEIFFPRVYCSYLGLDLYQFLQDFSFSFWEKLDGINRAVVADSSIRGRYHIMTNSDDNVSYIILENGKIALSTPMKDYCSIGELNELVFLYERVRNLDNFDSNHCPIMEFQTFSGRHYFLQYHRARNFEEKIFILNRELEDDEIQVDVVRGATPEEGFICKTTARYSAWESLGDYEKWSVSEFEEGSFDMHYNYVFTEIMTRRRRLQVLAPLDINVILFGLAIEHTQRSQLFNPEVSIIVSRLERLIAEEEMETFFCRARETGEDQYVTLRIISDGRKAYVKRLDKN